MSDINEKDKLLAKSNALPAPLRGNAPLVFIYKKAERLSAAIYLVTDLFDSAEPLRHELRMLSIALLKDILKIAEGGCNNDVLEKINIRIVEILSLLDIGHASGSVSEMNRSVLVREYRRILSFLEERKDDFAVHGGHKLSDYFFDVGAVPQREQQQKNIEEFNAEGARGEGAQGDTDGARGQGGAREYIKDIKRTYQDTRKHGYNERARSSSSDTARTQSGSGGSRGERRARIMSLVRERNNISVRDVARVVQGVSEKTLQRELLSMVSDGILRKKGERRWSTYSLNNNNQ